MRSPAAILVFGLAAAAPAPAVSQDSASKAPSMPTRAEVLVLGVYHMSNPGHEIFNTHADDVLAPERQAEIAQVIVALQTFRPSKIAVEADVNDDGVRRRYADYLAGEHELTRNETEQLGFRLARALGHETIYPVDVDGEFPYPRLVKYVQATGRVAELDTLEQETRAMVEAENAYLASHTVLETLLDMNSDERVAKDMAWYFRVAEFGEPWDWAGADLVSAWFRRNMRIYSNVLQLIDSPSERLLVLYGAGHLGWLQYAVRGNPTLRLRKLAEVAK